MGKKRAFCCSALATAEKIVLLGETCQLGVDFARGRRLVLSKEFNQRRLDCCTVAMVRVIEYDRHIVLARNDLIEFYRHDLSHRVRVLYVERR